MSATSKNSLWRPQEAPALDADLESSDLVDRLYQEGATKVVLPFTLISLTHNQDRTWTANFSEDSLSSNRIQHYIADEDRITVTQEV